MSDICVVPSWELPLPVLSRFLRSQPVQSGFRRSEAPSYYRWLLGSGAGKGTISWTAVDGDRPCASLTAILRPARIGTTTVLCAKLEEMRTDGAYRGRGLMSRVFERVRREAAEREVRLLLAGPSSPYSFPIFVNRYGFRPIRVRSVLRPLGVPWPASGSTETAGAQFVSTVPDGIDDLVAAATAAAPIALHRSSSYFSWRYDRHPDAYEWFELRDARRRLVSAAVLKRTFQRRRRLLNVVELLGDSGPELVARLARREQENGSSQLIALWPPRGDHYVSWLLRAFVPRPDTVPLLVCELEPLALTVRRRLYERRSWYLSMGDFFDL